jgi:FAD synthetase
MENAADDDGNRGTRHVKVMTTGVFDLLHPGHVHMLEEAKKLGDELIVVIARDESATKEKHAPITPEDHRQHMVQALKPVHRAVLGHLGDYYQIVEEEAPDIFALGFDQSFNAIKVQAEFDKRGIDCRVVRLPEYVGDLQGTRKIIEKISKRVAEDSLYTEGEA